MELLLKLEQMGCARSRDELPGMIWERGQDAWEAPGAGMSQPGPCPGGQKERGGSVGSSLLQIRLLQGSRSQHRLQLP